MFILYFLNSNKYNTIIIFICWENWSLCHHFSNLEIKEMDCFSFWHKSLWKNLWFLPLNWNHKQSCFRFSYLSVLINWLCFLITILKFSLNFDSYTKRSQCKWHDFHFTKIYYSICSPKRPTFLTRVYAAGKLAELPRGSSEAGFGASLWATWRRNCATPFGRRFLSLQLCSSALIPSCHEVINFTHHSFLPWCCYLAARLIM